ncbi:MAG: hypothetical protein M1821_000494 [Bathelium mastoideum]|nr:MAG: hypothetical protein M1821_000494 [Bathelium mastoideum]
MDQSFNHVYFGAVPGVASPFPGFHELDPLPDSPDSEDCFKMSRSWIERCVNEHEESICGAVNGNCLPTRVIDVGRFDCPPKLVVTKGEKARYIALSHCWGREQTYQTTRQTMASRCKALELRDMPKTFTDAIRLTRQHEIQYLWIDSLCIIQDDLSDWQQEASQMHEVYSGAFFVLSAASSPSDDHGFLKKFPYRVEAYKLESSEGSGVFDIMVQATKKSPHSLYDDPIKLRGWTLQEEHLARRVLQFGAHDVKFRCCTKRFSELKYYGYTDGQEGHSLFATLLGPMIHYKSRTAMYDQWHKVIENYSERSLSRENDRLPALSGLAATLNSNLQDEYLAGIWMRDVSSGLLWFRLYGEEEDDVVEGPTTLDCGTPSFSWASTTGEISYLLNGTNEDAVKTTVKVLNGLNHVDGANAYGVPTWGLIHLQGYLTEISIASEETGLKVHNPFESIETTGFSNVLPDAGFRVNEKQKLSSKRIRRNGSPMERKDFSVGTTISVPALHIAQQESWGYATPEYSNYFMLLALTTSPGESELQDPVYERIGLTVLHYHTCLAQVLEQQSRLTDVVIV